MTLQVFRKCLFLPFFEMRFSVQESDLSLMDLRFGSILYWVQSWKTSPAMWETSFQRPLGEGQVRSTEHKLQLRKEEKKKSKLKLEEQNVSQLTLMAETSKRPNVLSGDLWLKKRRRERERELSLMMFSFLNNSQCHGTSPTKSWHTFCGFVFRVSTKTKSLFIL